MDKNKIEGSNGSKFERGELKRKKEKRREEEQSRGTKSLLVEEMRRRTSKKRREGMIRWNKGVGEKRRLEMCDRIEDK